MFFKKITLGTNNEITRNKWIIETLKKIPNGCKILDAGAGEQQYKKNCSHLTYVSQDFAEYDGKGDGIGLHMGSWDQTKLDIISDITNIPVESKSFDAVMCTEVFEHLPNPILAIKEFSRITKKEGYLIITAPFCSMTHFAPYHFCTGFNRYFYEYHLKESGYEILEIIQNGNYFDYISQELWRLNSMKQKYLNKKLNIFQRFAIKIILLLLIKLNSLDNDSKNLMCFGYHVFAKKIKD